MKVTIKILLIEIVAISNNLSSMYNMSHRNPELATICAANRISRTKVNSVTI